jgi:hypothetical protein
MEANWNLFSPEMKDLCLHKLSSSNLMHFSQSGLTTLMIGLSRIHLTWNDLNDSAKQFLFAELERYFGFFTDPGYCPAVFNALRKLEVSYDGLSDGLSTVLLTSLNNSVPTMNLEVGVPLFVSLFVWFLISFFLFYLVDTRFVIIFSCTDVI